MASCILYQNPTTTMSLIDIPRSLELAQYLSPPRSPLPRHRRVLSSPPPKHPFPSLAPKRARAREKLGLGELEELEELLLGRYLELALEEVRVGLGSGSWLLPRAVGGKGEGEGEGDCGCEEGRAGTSSTRRKKGDSDLSDRDGNGDAEPHELLAASGVEGAENGEAVVLLEADPLFGGFFYQNHAQASLRIRCVGSNERGTIPPSATLLQGPIALTTPAFLAHAPLFNIIILDPPWPNRSARRRGAYQTSRAEGDISALLSSVPVHAKLAENGYVGVWVTNKAKFKSLVVRDGGLFEEWGVGLWEEWVWVKVTESGEMVCELGGGGREPFEVLLVGRRGVGSGGWEGRVKRRVIIGVPDWHSRKPNLKSLFEQVVGEEESCQMLEVFARNMTAGWWAWGDEVLNFQMDGWWVDGDEGVGSLV